MLLPCLAVVLQHRARRLADERNIVLERGHAAGADPGNVRQSSPSNFHGFLPPCPCRPFTGRRPPGPQRSAGGPPAGPCPPDHHQRRAAETVVVGGHGKVVGPCGEYRQKVIPRRLRQRDLLLNQVPALATPPGHSAQKISCLPHPAGREDRVRGLVKGIAGVVRHAAVDGDITPVPRNGLDPSHPVEG